MAQAFPTGGNLDGVGGSNPVVLGAQPGGDLASGSEHWKEANPPGILQDLPVLAGEIHPPAAQRLHEYLEHRQNAGHSARGATVKGVEEVVRDSLILRILFDVVNQWRGVKRDSFPGDDGR